MTEVDTLLHAGWILPVDDDNRELRNHTLVVDAGRIHDILPTTQARSLYRGRDERELPGHVLIPGLINAHTHAAMSLLRGLADDLPLMEWLTGHVWPAETRWVSEEFVHDGTQLAMAEMLRGGITCFNDMYFFPDIAARAASNTGMRACVGLIVIDFPSAWAGTAEEYLAKGLDVHDAFRHDPLIRTAFAPHAPYTVSDAPLQRLRVLADELEIPIHMHVHETAHEVDEAIANSGRRPLERLDELGLISPTLLAVHMTQLQDAEIAQLAARGCHVIHCPESNLKLASGFCPVQKLMQAGVNVALGTDGAASNNDLDLIAEMRTAALLAKAVAMDASALPAARALRMATINGARALGLGDETGSLEPGKSADVVAIDLSGIDTQPCYNPVSQLVYATGRDKVSDVWVMGQVLVKDRELTTLDAQDLLRRARTWRDRIMAMD